MAQAMKQNVTVSLKTTTVRKARILAARRDTSISGMLAEQIQKMVDDEDEIQRASASAIARLERGLRMGGGRLVSRDELHER
jgi:hypothetical protein